MNIFDPLASTRDALWWLSAPGLFGFARPVLSDTTTSVDDRRSAHPHFSNEADVPTYCPSAAVSLAEPGLSAFTGKPQWLTGFFHNNSEVTHFRLYVPSSYSGQRLPLVVMLHGAHQDADDFAAGTAMNQAAEEHGYIVVYPEQSESANLLRCWHWFRRSNRTRDTGETATIAALTRAIASLCDTDDTRIYVAGMSAGGAMAMNLAMTHPDIYAAAGVHSGVAYGVADDVISALCAMNDGMGKVRLPEAYLDECNQPCVPMIVFHGDADDTVHPRNGDQIVALCQPWLASDCPRPSSSTHFAKSEKGYAHTRKRFIDQEGNLAVEHWLVHGLGHAWSGGFAHGSYTDGNGPDATAKMIEFFAKFTLRNARTVMKTSVCG